VGRHSRPSNISKHARRFAVGGAIATSAVGLSGGVADAAENPQPTVNWQPIIQCESGGNPAAQNRSSTASGLFQFLDSSWAAYGGREFAPRAKLATAAEQTIVADRAYARAGLTPWTESRPCWGGKVTQPAPAAKVTPAPSVSTGRHASGKEATPSPTPRSAPRHAAPNPAPRQTAPQQASAPAGPAGTYTVHTGDTLSGIAFTHGHHDWHEMHQRNRQVIGENPNLILPGQVLSL
jgi:resuscitation-promoting factor RpfA